MLRALIVMIALAGCAQAPAPPVGQRVMTVSDGSASLRDAAHRPEFPLTIWYPARGGAAVSLRIGSAFWPLFEPGAVSPDAPLAAGGRRPLIILSHGFGGSARQMAWLGIALARHGYIVAAPAHPGSNALAPITIPGAAFWWLRAEDDSAAVSAMLSDPVFGPRIDAGRIGLAGFSAGGAGAAVIIGARPDMAAYLAFCAGAARDATCARQAEDGFGPRDMQEAIAASPVLRAAFAQAGADRHDARIRAALLIAPALGEAMDPASLRAIRVPALVIAGAEDPVAPPASNADVIAANIPSARLRTLQSAHYTFLSLCGFGGWWSLPGFCRDPQGVDRAAAHEAAIALAIRFFDDELRWPEN